MPTLNALSLALAGLLLPTLVCAAKPDPEIINAIRDQGFQHSQVMQTLHQLTDGIGPRLTNSPKMREATAWTQDQLKAWGLSNVHQEAFPFGRGWSYDRANIELLSPRKTSLQTVPLAWTPGTTGTVEGDVVHLDAVTEAELARFKGKLKGKVVLLSDANESEEPHRELSKRYSAAELAEMRNFNIKESTSEGRRGPDMVAQRREEYRFREARAAFLKAEGAVGALFCSSWDGGLIRVMGQSHRVGQTFPVPGLMLPAEHYNLLMRLLERGQTPRIAFNVQARFHDEDVNAHNVLAEIPGLGTGGNPPELVMLGAHLDSWHGATGGADNGAGVAITMEAVRILKAVGVQPLRTIRLALWAGEEQGLIGSAAYVEEHFASRPKPSDPKERELSRWLWSSPGWPITKKPDYDRLSLYFNIDNGSGKLRGIATQGNAAARGPLAEWFAQVGDLSEGTISNNYKSSTDHVAFDVVGLPGFQFIQDPLDYMTRLHHTHVDSADHIIPEDMKQAAVVLATLVYNAAIADSKLPRKPLPTEPTAQEQAESKSTADKRTRSRERKALSELPGAR